MTGVTELDTAGEKLIAGFEGGQSPDGLYRAYYDEYGHVWTIGCGETHYEGGPVPPSLVWTPAQAYADLHDTFARDYAPAINDLGVDLNQNQFNALGDYVWNCGGGGLELYGVAFYLKSGDWEGAAAAIRRAPVTAGGVVLSGLVHRRETEATLFLTPEPLPLDPHHYHEYPDAKMIYKGRTFHERALAQDIDGWLEHPHLHRGKLEAALPLAQAAAARIWVVSVYEAPSYKVKKAKPDWSYNRGSRYQWWGARIRQVKKALA